MFNLIVKAGGWAANGRDTIPASRALSYTDGPLIDRFMPAGRLDVAALSALPALFLEEGRTNEIARIATVTRARLTGRELSIDYALDPGIPTFRNADLREMAVELDMVDFEFIHTHWAVKNVDLYRVLLRNARPPRQRPTVFQLPDREAIEESLISVMMPFDARFNPVYAALRGLVEQIGMECRRADDIWKNDAVIQDIVSLIDESKVVIGDCSGRNPNVFYEIGIAHTLGRNVVLITQHMADIPFDLRHLRAVEYLPNNEGLARLADQLRPRLVDLAG
jgi:hypothetical protein